MTTSERGAEAWAIWNPCQGVFTCSVFHTRREAQAALDKWGDDDSARVVPVRVIVEPVERWPYRQWAEDDMEKVRG